MANGILTNKTYNTLPKGFVIRKQESFDELPRGFVVRPDIPRETLPQNTPPTTTAEFARGAHPEYIPDRFPISEAITKGLIGGGLQAGGAGGTLAEIVGTEIKKPVEFPYRGLIPPEQPEWAKSVQKKVGGFLQEKGKTVREYFGEKKEKYQPPEEYLQNIIDKPALLKNPKWWAYSVSNMIPSLGVAVGAGMVGGPVFGGMASGLFEGAGTYEQVIQKGGTPEEAARKAEQMAVASGILNAISLGQAFKFTKKGVLPKVAHFAKAGATEAITEAAEEPAEAVILGESIPQSLKQAATVALPAGLMGLAGGGAGFTRTTITPTETIEKVTPSPLTPLDIKITPPPTLEPKTKVTEGVQGETPKAGEVPPQFNSPLSIEEQKINLKNTLETMQLNTMEVASESSDSQYLYIEAPEKAIKIRISDHVLPSSYYDLFGGADFEIGNHIESNGDWADAIAYIARKTNKEVPIQAIEEFKTRQRKTEQKRASELEQQKVFEERESAITTWLNQHGYKELYQKATGRQRKNLRAKAIKATEKAGEVPQAPAEPMAGEKKKLTIQQEIDKLIQEGTPPEVVEGPLTIFDKLKKKGVERIAITQALRDHLEPEELKAIAKQKVGIFSNKVTATARPFDEVAATMGMDVDDLAEALRTAKTRRQAFDDIKRQREIQKEGVNPPVKVSELELEQGDKFKIAGEDYKVTDKAGEVLTIKNKETFKVVPTDEIPSPDIGSIEYAGTEFSTSEQKAPTEPAPEQPKGAEGGEGEFGGIRLTKEPERYFKLSDKEVDTRIQANKQGVTPQTLVSKAVESTKEFAKGFTKTFRAMPNDEFHALAKQEVMIQQEARSIGSEAATRKLADVVRELRKADADLFTYAVIANDLVESAQIANTLGEPVKLPFGLTEKKLPQFKAEVDGQVSKFPLIQDAVNKFYAYNKELTQTHIQAASEINPAFGRELAKKYQREQYFHHQIMEYAGKAKMRGAKGLKTNLWFGALAKRYGSMKDINANIVQAQFKVWSQIEHDIRVLQSLKKIKDKYDITPILKNELKKWRMTTKKGLAWRGDFIDQSGIGTTISKKMERLYKIAEEKGVAIEEGTITDSQSIKWENETARLTKEIQDEIELYRKTKLSDPAEQARLEDWYKEKIAKKLDVEPEMLEEIFTEEINTPSLEFIARPVTGFQMALLNGEIKPMYLYKKFDFGREYKPVTVRDIMYRAHSIGEDVAQDIFKNQVEKVIGKDDLKEILAKADSESWVLPKTITDTVRELEIERLRVPHVTGKIFNASTKGIKRWFLFNPFSVMRYIRDNSISDYTYMASVAPKAVGLKYQLEAFRTLRQIWKNKPMLIPKNRAEDITQFVEHGGETVGFTTTQMEFVPKHPVFKAFKPSTSLLQKMEAVPMAYFDAVSSVNSFTETQRRLSAYLYILDQLKEGKDVGYFSSKKTEIDGLPTIYDKAYKMAQDILIDYNATSSSGKELGKYALFWSFREGNFKRFANTVKNITLTQEQADKITHSLLRKTAKVSALTSMRLASWFIRVAGLLGVTYAWNNIFFPDEEEEIAQEARFRPHVIVGRDGQGNVMYWDTYDSLHELLRWFGLHNPVYMVKRILQGRARDVIEDIVYAPIDSMYGLLNPQFKIPFELGFGETGYPTLRLPRPITNPYEYFLRIWKLDPEYRALTGRAERPGGYLGERLAGLFIKRIAPGSSAYWEIQNLKRRFSKEFGLAQIEATGTPSGKALYEWRRAIKLNDKPAAERWLKKYFEAAGIKGTKKPEEGMVRSLQNMHPIYGLGNNTKKFLSSLDKGEKTLLEKAIQHYHQVILGKRYRNLIVPEVQRLKIEARASKMEQPWEGYLTPSGLRALESGRQQVK